VNAIDLLKEQHRDVEELFEEYEVQGDGARKAKERLCREIADHLAVHAEIEEKIFYPEAKQKNTEELLRESVEEHLAMKRTLADLLQADVEDAQFDARMTVLKELVEHHVEEEEKELFPRIEKSCSKEELEDMGVRMQEMADELESEGEPSRNVPGQTDKPAPI
jgi:hemerythrin-like domain-containing protein